MTTDLFERLKQASVFIRSPDGNTGSGYLIASAAHCFVRAEAERVRSTEATLDLFVYRSADRAVGHVAATEGGVGNGGSPHPLLGVLVGGPPQSALTTIGK